MPASTIFVLAVVAAPLGPPQPFLATQLPRQPIVLPVGSVGPLGEAWISAPGHPTPFETVIQSKLDGGRTIPSST